MTFLNIGLTDVLDIFIVAFLMYQVYMLIKGTTAMKIFAGIAVLYLLWLLVRALNMQLISTILGQVMGVGVIAMLIVFQQEIRKFFMYISTRYLSRFDVGFRKLGNYLKQTEAPYDYDKLAKAVQNMASTQTGALIVMKREADLFAVVESGLRMNAELSQPLLEAIFQKYSPLHDGAIVVREKIIEASKCILPLSEKENLPESFGLRHRAAMGLSERSDAVIIVVSEETGEVRLFYNGRFRNVKDSDDLKANLMSKLHS